MGLSGCMSCLKYLLFAFNFIFWLAGVGILAMAIFFRFDGSTSKVLESDADQRDMFYAVCYVLMAVGAAIMVVGFCGCCGAVQESKMLLSMFAIALFLLLGTEIGAGVYTHFNKDKVVSAVDMSAVDAWKISATARNETAMVVRGIENDLDCCGYYSVADYCSLKEISLESVLGTFVQSRGVVECNSGPTKKISDICPTVGSALNGCRDRMKAVLESNLKIVVAVAIGVGVVQLLGMIFSILLCQAIGQDYTSGKLA